MSEALIIDPDGTKGTKPFVVWCKMIDEPPVGVTVSFFFIFNLS